MINCGH